MQDHVTQTHYIKRLYTDAFLSDKIIRSNLTNHVRRHQENQTSHEKSIFLYTNRFFILIADIRIPWLGLIATANDSARKIDSWKRAAFFSHAGMQICARQSLPRSLHHAADVKHKWTVIRKPQCRYVGTGFPYLNRNSPLEFWISGESKPRFAAWGPLLEWSKSE